MILDVKKQNVKTEITLKDMTIADKKFSEAIKKADKKFHDVIKK